ncbi:hypothetical protein HDU96_009658 [Phlyctochytrium bullatum]|nr:hypothetical protein HDU96_009658 [Phlyctochytrium bullatum]
MPIAAFASSQPHDGAPTRSPDEAQPNNPIALAMLLSAKCRHRASSIIDVAKTCITAAAAGDFTTAHNTAVTSLKSALHIGSRRSSAELQPVSDTASDITFVVSDEAPPVSPETHRQWVLAHLRELHAEAERAGMDEPDPQFRLAQFTLEQADHLPPTDRDRLIDDAVAIIDRLAMPDDVFTGEGGHTNAVLMAANLTLTGVPGRDPPAEPNYPLAFALYLRAVDGGSPAAAHNAALLLEHGRVSLTPDASPSADPTHRKAAKKDSRRATDAAVAELHATAAAANHPGSLLWLHKRRLREAEKLLLRRDPGDRWAAETSAIESLDHLRVAALNATSVHPDPLHALAMLVLTPPRVFSSESAKRRAAAVADDVADALMPGFRQPPTASPVAKPSATLAPPPLRLTARASSASSVLSTGSSTAPTAAAPRKHSHSSTATAVPPPQPPGFAAAIALLHLAGRLGHVPSRRFLGLDRAAVREEASVVSQPVVASEPPKREGREMGRREAVGKRSRSVAAVERR